jgi:hypothetical protein
MGRGCPKSSERFHIDPLLDVEGIDQGDAIKFEGALHSEADIFVGPRRESC